MLIHSTEVVTGKKNHDFNKEQAHTHATNVSRILPAPKEKKAAVFKPNYQNIGTFCMSIMHVQSPWNRNAVGKSATSDISTKLLHLLGIFCSRLGERQSCIDSSFRSAILEGWFSCFIIKTHPTYKTSLRLLINKCQRT